MKKLALATVCALSVSAFAQSAANVSATNSSASLADKIAEQMDLGYSAEFYGPGVGDLSATRANDTGTKLDNKQNDLMYDQQVSIDYHLFDDKELTLKLRMRSEFGSSENNRDATQLRNSRIGIQGTWYENGNFSYWSRYHVELPNATISKRRGMIMGVGAAQDFALRVSDKIIVGAEQSTYLTAYDNTQAGNVYMYNAPYLNVALTDMATLKSRYEYEILSNTKDELNKDSSRLLSGVDLQLNEKWSIYPHLSLGLDGQINTKALGVNFWLSGAIF